MTSAPKAHEILSDCDFCPALAWDHITIMRFSGRIRLRP
jgi:hypothetical protein